jgi:serine/threonine protein kinase
MEYCEKNLDSHAKDNKRPDELPSSLDDAVPIASDIARGLIFIHNKGEAHREWWLETW